LFMFKCPAYKCFKAVMSVRIWIGPGVWLMVFLIVAMLLFAAALTSPNNVLVPLFAVALMLLVMAADAALRRPVARLFNPALVSLVDEIVRVFDEKGVGAWNDGVLRGKYHAALLLLRDAAHLALGRSSYSRSARSSFDAVADKLLAQGGDWAEVRSELLRLRECAKRGEVGSPRCALVSEKGATGEKRSLWERLQRALPGAVVLTTLLLNMSKIIELINSFLRWLSARWP